MGISGVQVVGHRGYRASYGANNHYLHLEDSPFSRIYFTLLKRPRMTIHEDDLDMSNSFLSSLKTVEMFITLNPKNSDIGQQIDKYKPCLCLQCVLFWWRWELSMERSLVDFHSSHTARKPSLQFQTFPTSDNNVWEDICPRISLTPKRYLMSH